MKPHLQCAEQQVSLSNLTKYCACHAERLAVLSPHHIWNLIYNAQSNRCHDPTSPNTAPCHAERLTFLIIITYETSVTMRGATGVTVHLTKYCACHQKDSQYLVLITYETSFTMRSNRCHDQPHQILRLSRRKTHLLNHHYISNLIYKARSNRCHGPTSPNTAPVTQKDSHT